MKLLKFMLPVLIIVFFIVMQIFLPVNINSQEIISDETEYDSEGVQVFEDIASIFYYGNGDTRIHTWINSGNKTFKYSGSNGWFSTKKGGYEGNKLLHSIAGDWNADGFTDLAGFYDYGQGVTRIHVWLNNGGTRFNYQKSAGWWESTRGYNANNIVSASTGDYNGDGYDDIAAFYDYGNDETRIHVWLSNGSSRFNYEGSRGWWAVKGYPSKNIINTLSGEFGD